MKAVVYKGPMEVAVENVPDPKIEHPTDAIIRITSSAICGSDLHMYDGHTSAKPGMVFGHEPMGIVQEVGSAIRLIKKGDRVVVPFNVACGDCLMCVQGFTNACLTMNPENAGAAYGYAQMGPFRGAQAEYLRVPNADWACLKVPGTPKDSYEDSFLMLADIFPTGYYATVLAMVGAGKSVAIFGAGPVGLLAAHSSKLIGASEIHIVDKSKKRLMFAKTTGAYTYDFTKGDPAEQIKAFRKSNHLIMASFRPGEEKMSGVMCAIDAVGYQAYDRTSPDKFKPNQVLMDIAKVINPGGSIGVVGVYVNSDPAEKDPHLKKGEMMMPWGDLWMKGVRIGTGQTPVKMLHIYLRDMILGGVAKPDFIVTHHIKIEDAPKFYKEFDKRDEVIKAVIQF